MEHPARLSCEANVGSVGLLKRMSRLELEEDSNVEEHLIAMNTMFDKLAEVGCEIAEELKGGFILASLPESYDGFVTVMEGMDGGTGVATGGVLGLKPPPEPKFVEQIFSIKRFATKKFFGCAAIFKLRIQLLITVYKM